MLQTADEPGFPWTSGSLMEPEPWTRDALCTEVDPELFFPDGSPARARAICGRCDVAAQCLKYALDNDERFGVWGGFTRSERVRMVEPRRVRPPEYNANRAAAKRRKYATDPEYRERQNERRRLRRAASKAEADQ